MKTKFIRFATGIMAFILCMAVFTGLTGVSLAAESAEGAENRLPLFVDNGLNNAYTMEVGDAVAARFETTDVIAAVNIDVKRVVMSAGQPKMTASVYRWTDTYEDTLKTTPIISETIKDLKGNTTYRVEADSALPAGEYLVVCSSTGGKWNLGKYYSDIGGISWYKNGASDSYAYSIAVESANASNTLIAGASDASSLGARPDTWVAVDGLGRTLSDYEAVGGEKADKQVGIFYWTGSGRWGQSTTAYNITERLNSVSSDVALAARNDYEHSLWQTDSAPSWFWDEPLFGYYTTNDDYVVRKHAEMLADAGVDVIFFDCCVGLDNTSSYMNVFEIFAQARKEGVNTPDIAFMLPMGDAEACATYLRRLYEQIYSQGLYEDLWYYFGDSKKPLILAYKDQLDNQDELDREIIRFFQFRRADAWSWRTEDFYSSASAPFWGWLSTYPQAKYFIDGKLEQITVGVAQNVDVIEHKPTAMNGTNVAGRSYVYGDYSYSYTARFEQ